MRSNGERAIALDDDVLHSIFSFLDVKDLSFFSAVSREIRNSRPLEHAWTTKGKTIIGGQFAPVYSSDESVAARVKVILAYRAAHVVARLEHRCVRPSFQRKANEDRVCPSCGILPQVQMEAFHYPRRYSFYARIATSFARSKQHAIWSGFLPQAGHSPGIMSFYFNHMGKEKPYLRNGESKEDNENGFDRRLDWRKLTIIILAFRKDDPLAGPPSLVMCNSRMQAVATDSLSKFVCYQMRKRHCGKVDSPDDIWVAARVFVTNPDQIDGESELSSIHAKVEHSPQSTFLP